MTARREARSVAWHRASFDREALRHRGKVRTRGAHHRGIVASRQGASEGVRQGARRGDRASRHRATRSSRSGEASCVIDAHARARGWRDPDNQNLSRERAPFKQSIKKNPIIMIFYFLDRI